MRIAPINRRRRQTHKVQHVVGRGVHPVVATTVRDLSCRVGRVAPGVDVYPGTLDVVPGPGGAGAWAAFDGIVCDR
jgi:hypothetical protein